MEEIQLIEDKLTDLRKRYPKASENKKKFYIVLANGLKDKQKRIQFLLDKYNVNTL